MTPHVRPLSRKDGTLQMISQKQFSYNNFRAMCRQKVAGLQTSTDTWDVPSTTAVGVWYTVKVSFDGELLWLDCECASGKHAQGCKHALWVARAINFDPRLLDALIRERRAA